MQPNPWEDISRRYPIGTEVNGEITSVTDFGAFVKLEEGIEGLVYSSEISAEKVEKPSDLVQPGQVVKALVVKVDAVEGKISLSMRAVNDRQERETLKDLAQQTKSQTATLGDLLREKLERKGQDS
jgi:small subunit ribosomal protein S1